MKKKSAPEQYAAKPKTVAVKSAATPHPAVGVAKILANWLTRGGVPPSVILLHGLYLARSAENDGLPVDTYRPQFKMQGDDNRVISEMLDALARPQVDKVQVIAAWLQANWVKKSAVKPASLQKKREAPQAAKRKPKIAPTKKPVVVIKIKR